MTSHKLRWTARLSAMLATGVIAAAGLIAVAQLPAAASHGTFTVSTGAYRIPYADGTDLTVTQDHHTHGGVGGNKDRIDMTAGEGAQIVAAASGWIRGIVDTHGNDPGAGDGMDINGAPQDDTLEHSCGNNDPSDTVVGDCSDYNNYVWLEHPNGEWTKYTHFGTGTVTALGWVQDAWIEAGEVLGLESDIGQATSGDGVSPAFHLHFEVAIANDPTTDLTWGEDGGFFNNGQNLVPFVCDIGAPNLYVQGADHTANPCLHQPPTADAGGPYVVDEGSTVVLDGSGSADPEGNPLTYCWSLAIFDDCPDPLFGNLDDVSLAQPTYTGVDDTVEQVQLSVYDQIEQLDSSDLATVTVLNVPPTVTASGDSVDEAGTATVSATFTDPGTQDSHTADIDWGDGSAPTPVSVGQLVSGVDHVYGDNGTFTVTVTVTVTDDDGGTDSDTADVVVGNLDPTVLLDTDDAVTFPGGDFLLTEAGELFAASADCSDPGSDDLTFTWSLGESTTYFNDGVGPDPLPSPFGTFPFLASDSADDVLAAPGVEQLMVTCSDDDGGSHAASAEVLVLGTAESTEGPGWWKHQYSGDGSPHIDPDIADGYLEIVNAVSGVFSESTSAMTAAQADQVLSAGGDARSRAEAALLVAWLQFASGAVPWDATVTLTDGSVVDFLALITTAESVILNPASDDAALRAVTRDLARVRHAG